jgi:hypothetical protein
MRKIANLHSGLKDADKGIFFLLLLGKRTREKGAHKLLKMDFCAP